MKAKKKPRKETKEVVLGKDFNSSAGGIFFGEVGLQSWKETGRIPTRSKEATLGWGPPVLLLLVAAAGVTYKTTGALSVGVDEDGRVGRVRGDEHRRERRRREGWRRGRCVGRRRERVTAGGEKCGHTSCVGRVWRVGVVRVDWERCESGEENGRRFREDCAVGHGYVDDCKADFALTLHLRYRVNI